MPSLEIICIEQIEPSDFSRLPFLVEAETKLVSHRSPTPLFQADFDELSGCIYHLLDERKVTAFDLMERDWHDDESDFNVEFKREYAPFLKQILEQLLRVSPVGRILFTTDYQFGPDETERHGPISLENFWQLHDAGKLTMNALYLLTAN